MLQILTAIMKEPTDPTVCHLLFANQVSLPALPWGRSVPAGF